MQKLFTYLMFISLAFLPQKVFSQEVALERKDQLKASLELAVKWAYDKKKMEELQPYAPFLVNSADVELKDFPHDDKVVSVFMREGLLAFADEEVKYIGTTGIGPCIGLVLVVKKDGKVDRVALAHVDAMTQLMESSGFFYRAMLEADEVEVSLVASQGSIETALKIIERIEFVAAHNAKFPPKITYKADLTASSELVVDVQTGQLYKGLNYPSDFRESAKELDKKLGQMPFLAMMRAPLKWNLYKYHKRRFAGK